MPDLSPSSSPGADPSEAIIAACHAAKTRLESVSDVLELVVAMAELACTLSTLEESLTDWAMAADQPSADAAREAIAAAARRPR